MTDVAAAVRALRAGELAIFPTETLWSLSAGALAPEAAAKVFAAKGRPEGVPLAVGFASWQAARPFIDATPLAERLAEAFLPGPLSIVVRRRDERLAHVAPGLDTVSVRVPDHVAAREVLEGAGPCIMTSANRHGEADPRTVDEVQRAFPGVPVVDGSVPGTASTVVDATGEEPVVLREGVVPASAF